MTMWLIWSNEHGAWWGPNSNGYTRLFSKAGRYTEKQAKDITKNANIFFDKEPNEVALCVSNEYTTEPSFEKVMP